MATINVRIKAEALGKSIEKMSQETQDLLQESVASLATAAYSEAIRLAQAKLKTTQRDYVNALQFEKIDDNVYIITLSGPAANAIENGWGSFDMKPGLLAGPNSKVTKKGTRYNTVPFSYQPTSNAPLSPKNEELRSSLRDVIKANGLSKIIKNQATGKPLEGIVARVKNTGIKNLDGLVKIQKTYGNKTQSTYMTFRRVSTNSKAGSWMHPGYAGAKIFPMVEQFIESQLDVILSSIL